MVLTVIQSQQPESQPASDTDAEAQDTLLEDSTQVETVEQVHVGSDAEISAGLANMSVDRVESSVEEEIVHSSVEELDELLDDNDPVEETIVYQPPGQPKAVSTPVKQHFSVPVPISARAEPTSQVDSQCVPDSQPAESAIVSTDTESASVLLCESPRKRKSEDG